MGNANTHERRKSGVPETGLTIEDIRAPSVSLYQPEEAAEPTEHGGGGGTEPATAGPSLLSGSSSAVAAKKKTPPPSFETTGVVERQDGVSAPQGFRQRAGTMGVDVSSVLDGNSPQESSVIGAKGLPTIFKYSGNAKEAYVCGTFSNWKKIPMVKSQKDFVALIDLPVGEHQYKFFVDETWTHDSNLPTVRNELGSKNNVIKIQQDDFDAFSALDMDSKSTNLRHRRGGEMEWGQEVPGLHSFENKPGPPILPPHLLQVILNKDTPLSCEPTLLPEPNHVMINHLYALSIKDGVMVISSTQRYRKKYVTTLLYKPIEGAA